MSYTEQSKANEQVIAAIKREIAGWESAVNQGNAAGATAAYAADAILMPPHATSVIGRDAIQPFFQQAFFDPFNLKISLTTDEIQVFGDSAFRRGRWHATSGIATEPSPDLLLSKVSK